ncbi:hypothetical protein Tco_1310479 [Tanacetum coccineum]
MPLRSRLDRVGSLSLWILQEEMFILMGKALFHLYGCGFAVLSGGWTGGLLIHKAPVYRLLISKEAQVTSFPGIEWENDSLRYYIEKKLDDVYSRGSRSRAQCFLDPYVAAIIRSRGSFNEFTWYKNKVLYIRIVAYSDQARPTQTFVSTSWRHPWDPTLGITLVRMSMMANATPIVTTATKTTNKEKVSDAAPRVNIQDFCEEHYEDILPIIMEKARRDKRKEVQTRLNFGEISKRTRRERENSLNSRAENSPARFHPVRSRTRGRERRDDRNVFSHMSHRRKSVHERLSDTYLGPIRTDSREPSHGRGHSHRGHSHIRERFQTEDMLPWLGNANMTLDLRLTEDVLPWPGNANMALDLQPTEDVLPWPGNANMTLDLRPTEDVFPWPGNANMAFDLVPDLQCLLRIFYIRRYLRDMHEDNYNGIVIPL